MRSVRPARAFRALPLAPLAFVASAPALAQVAAPPDRAEKTQRPATTANHVAEAARRFGVPESWVWAVMRIESAGDPRALSPAGAMGLMQIMPETWAYLRARYGLGDDPFDRRDNILAGTAYLRELHDRFGAPGFLAAYNAGPGRYSEYLSGGRPLPAATRLYLAQLAPVVGGTAIPRRAVLTLPDRDAWTRADLFPRRSDEPATDDPAAASAPADALPVSRLPVASSRVGDAPAPRDAIFVALGTTARQ